jgi:hypothetical protein
MCKREFEYIPGYILPSKVEIQTDGLNEKIKEADNLAELLTPIYDSSEKT